MDKKIKVQQTVSNQIIQDIYLKIANGTYKFGEKVPSVRDMAKQWSTSPDTVIRAYSQLERISLIERKQGLGTFIVNDEKLIKSFRISLVAQKLDNFIIEMREIGVSVEEIIEHIESKYPIVKDGILNIENAETAKKFLAGFEKYAVLNENGHYSITFRNEIDYIHEEVWTTLYKSNGKWYYYSEGKKWKQPKAKEMRRIVPFVLKYSKAIIKKLKKG